MVLVYRGETMRLIQMRVTNFSSFKDTGWIEFSPGINLIVGQNNAGKSALLRVFDQSLEDNRHRNTAEYQQERLERPGIEFDLDVSGHEVEDAMSTCTARSGVLISWSVQTTNADAEWEKISLFLSEPSHILELRRHAGNIFTSRGNPLHGQFQGTVAYILPLIVVNGRIQSSKNVHSGGEDNLYVAMEHLWLANVFSFSAQRHSWGRSGFGREDRLKSDASNLAGILSKLQGERGNRSGEFAARIQCRGEGAPVVIPTRFTEDVRADARILAQEEAAFSAASFALASALPAVRAARSECHAAVIYCVNRPNGSASTFVSGL